MNATWENLAALGLSALIVAAVFLAGRATYHWTRSRHITADDALTVAAALVAAMFGGQGMWGFFRATLHLPVPLTALGFSMFELTMLVCALRARRNLLANSASGPEGAMLWLFAGLAGFFSATHASSWAEAAFRFIVPSIAAWLWHRLMRLEHRQVTGKLSGINWRVTPERVLIKLGLADPTDRTAAQVSVERTLMNLAIAAHHARGRKGLAKWVTRRRRATALQKATEYGGLATSPAAQQLLLANLGSLNGAAQLSELTPPAPWLAAVDGQPSRLEAELAWMAERDMIDLTPAAKAVLTQISTGPRPPRPHPVADRMKLVELPTRRPAPELGLNRDIDWATDGNRPGQGNEIDLRSTVAATIRELNARGFGEQRIADDLEVSRHWVRKILGRDTQPATTGPNGHDLTATADG